MTIKSVQHITVVVMRWSQCKYQKMINVISLALRLRSTITMHHIAFKYVGINFCCSRSQFKQYTCGKIFPSLFPGPLPRLFIHPIHIHVHTYIHIYILKARRALDVNKSFGSLYNAGIKTVFIVILEMIPGGRPFSPYLVHKCIGRRSVQATCPIYIYHENIRPLQCALVYMLVLITKNNCI